MIMCLTSTNQFKNFRLIYLSQLELEFMEMQWQLVVECWADESSLGILDVEFPIAHSISLQSFPRSYKLINTFIFIFLAFYIFLESIGGR